MDVVIDQEKCIAAGQCVAAAPGVFDQREEDGVVVLLTSSPGPAEADGVRHAARVCPAQVIEVLG